ncbi:MAG TPA: hypothetical protein VIX89_04615 [Bryobacteraceae bacterium]
MDHTFVLRLNVVLGKLGLFFLIPPMLSGQRSNTDIAIQRGLAYIYQVASDPKSFAGYGHDLLWCFYTISSTAKDPELRKIARIMGHERALEWRRIHPRVPSDSSADEISNLVFGSDAADRLGVVDPRMKERLRRAAAQYSAVDFLDFDPTREPPPSDLPMRCRKCARENKRGATVCAKCGGPLIPRDRYDVWSDALINTYTGDIYGIKLGAHYPDVLRWISAMRPYPARETLTLWGFYNVAYAVTHVVYTLNGYGHYRLSPKWLPQEYKYLRENMREAVKEEDPETLGEFLDTLRAFGLTESSPLIRQGVAYVLSKQNEDGSWGEIDDADVYNRYHSTWTAIDGLREYAWRGRRLSFPVARTLSYRHGLRAQPSNPSSAQAR